VIETGAAPEFVSVTGTDAELPTRIPPNGMLAGFELSAPCAPVPLKEIDSVGFVAFVVIVIVPDAAPVVVGANLAVTDAVPPAAIICPTVIPVVLKPEPLVPTVFTVIAVFPELVSVIACVLLVANWTLLKLKLPGLAVKVLPLATALPVIVRVCGELGALSVKTMLPLSPVVDVGVN
jgi:hypothetical protein